MSVLAAISVGGHLSSFLQTLQCLFDCRATGLPRETVRRKIMRLEELGWVTRVPEGGVVVSGRCIDHTYQNHPETWFNCRDLFHLRRHFAGKVV